MQFAVLREPKEPLNIEKTAATAGPGQRSSYITGNSAPRRQDCACDERIAVGQQDVASADSNSQCSSDLSPHHGRFKLNIAITQAARHRATILVCGDHGSVKNIFKSRKLRY